MTSSSGWKRSWQYSTQAHVESSSEEEIVEQKEEEDDEVDVVDEHETTNRSRQEKKEEDEEEEDARSVGSDRTVELDSLKRFVKMLDSEEKDDHSGEDEEDENDASCPVSTMSTFPDLKSFISKTANFYSVSDPVVVHALYVVCGCPQHACDYLCRRVMNRPCTYCSDKVESYERVVWTVEDDRILLAPEARSAVEREATKKGIVRLLDCYGPKAIERRMQFLDPAGRQN